MVWQDLHPCIKRGSDPGSCYCAPDAVCAFSVIFLIRTAYTYSLIQHAISETASEMASAGYIYQVSGIRTCTMLSEML